VIAIAHPYVFHPYQKPHDWLIMGLIVLAFALPEAVSRIRHRIWRRRVLSACR
jgi:divalent metal cation (Fe/Co/Zn/Cd) transporter